MSIVNSGVSAIGRLAAVAVLAAAFLFGMAGVVYMSLQGKEVQVPEITGKPLDTGETELASLGLKIKKRADRFSEEAPGTVIEQLPKAGETVKTGQMILVVTSKGPGDGSQPKSLLPTNEQDDTEKIEEMISDKPKKAKANTNSNRKKADTARDVTSENSNSNTAGSGEGNSNKKDPGTAGNAAERPKANTAPASNRPNPTSTRPSERPKTGN